MASYSRADDTGTIDITLGTFRYPPLMFNEPDRLGRWGIGIDLLIRAFERSERYRLEVILYPPKRAMSEFKRGNTDVFLGSRMDVPSIAEQLVALQLLSLKSVLFCLPINCQRLQEQEQQQHRSGSKGSPLQAMGTVATLIGSPVNQTLRDMGNQVVTFQTLERSFYFMLAGRSDYVAAIDFSGLYVLAKMGNPSARHIQTLPVPLLNIPYDALVLKSNEHAVAIIKIVKAEISRREISSTEQVLEQYLSP